MMATGHVWRLRRLISQAVGAAWKPDDIIFVMERSCANRREQHGDFATILMRVYWVVIDRQPRLMSFVESLTNVAVGFGLAVLTQLIVLPWFGVQMSISDNLALGTVFTVVSLVRSYVLRRFFEALRSGG